MATQHNFRIKNGLEVAGTERISSAGAFTGSLASATTATTQSATDNSTKIATTAYTDAAITAVIGGAPGTLDTLNELAAAINDDASYASTLTTALATKLPLAGGTMTGTLKTPNLTINDGVQEFDKPNVKGFRFLHNDAGNDLSIQQGDTNNANYVTKLNISTDGNVGIGTNSPLGKLSVGAGSINDAGLPVQISTGADGTQIWYAANRNGGYGALFGYSASSTYKGLVLRNVVSAGTANADGISFMTNNTSMRMHITGDGKVGIGCTPARDLHLRTEGSTNGFRIQSNDENLVFLGAAGSSGSAVDDGYFALDSQGSNKIFMNTASTVGAVLDASSSTNSIRVPAGTTAQRPTGASGMIRYNTSDSKLETYNGMWLPVKTEAPLSFQQASTYHQKWTIAADGQSAQAGSSYSAITVNLNFEGNFTIITKWHHTYMGVGIGYKAGITNGNFTGESNDAAGPYAGGTTVDGFDSTVSLMGQYHWPIVGGGGNSILYYIKHQRAGNTISTHYSTNASSATNPSHSSWSQVQTATIASTDHCKPVWGEAHSGETVPLTLLYNDISGSFNGS